jgi:hypothetical protein
MARARLRQKIARVVDFMLGLRDPYVAAALAEVGFGQADLDRAWDLLRDAIGAAFRPGPAPRPSPGPHEALARLDAWENRWFPIAAATLEHNHPEVHAEVFLNLGQTSGGLLAVTVHTFLERLARLDAAGGERAAARRLLAQRGLDAAMERQARELLAQVQAPVAGPLPVDPEARRAQRDAAEAALWRWYLEWSRIARTVIREPGQLRQLGFRRGRDAEG